MAISKDGILHGAAMADATGLAEVTLRSNYCAWYSGCCSNRQNGQPYIGTVTVASPTGPYFALENITIDDIAGNNNGQADYNES